MPMGLWNSSVVFGTFQSYWFTRVITKFHRGSCTPIKNTSDAVGLNVVWRPHRTTTLNKYGSNNVYLTANLSA